MMMNDKTKQENVYAFLKENAYPYYKENDHRTAREWQDEMYRALLHSISEETLRDLVGKLELDADCPSTLYYKAKGVLKSKERALHANVPTVTLLKWYTNKKSGKVNVAIKELMSRFHKESAERQRTILKAFLFGGKKEMEWAARYLRDHWTRSMTVPVGLRWKETHDRYLAYVVLRHMPTAFVMAEKENLAKVTKFTYVYLRLYKMTGFEMDKDRVSVPDYFYLSAKLGLPVEGLEEMLTVYLPANDYISSDDIGRIIWAMGKLGMTDALIRFAPLFQEKQKAVEVQHPELDFTPSELASFFDF